MGRAKIQIEPIEDKTNRRITFHRRKGGIMKKALQLSALCDVNVSMIVCSDYQEKPIIFPSDPSKFEYLINLQRQNRRTNPAKVQSYGLSDYFKDRKNKVEDELSKAKKKTRETMYPTWFDFLNDFSEAQLREFSLGLVSKIDIVKRKIESVKELSKIQNLDHDPFCPGNSVLDGQSSLIMPLLNLTHPMGYNSSGFNHNVGFSGDQNYLIMQSSDPNSVMKIVMPMDYNNLGFDPVNLIGDQNNLIMQSSNTNSWTKLLFSEDENRCYNRDQNGLSKYENRCYNCDQNFIRQPSTQQEYHFPPPDDGAFRAHELILHKVMMDYSKYADDTDYH